MEVIGREPHVGHGACLDPANAGAKGILLAHRARDDRLKVHHHIVEEVLGQIGAVEAHALVWIVAVIVIPVQQRARGLRCQGQGMHADAYPQMSTSQALGNEVIAHHAHHRARHHAEVFFQRCPALHRAHRAVCVCCIQCSMTTAQLAHLDQRGDRDG